MARIIQVLMALLLAMSAWAIGGIHEIRAVSADPVKKALDCGIFSTASKKDVENMMSFFGITKGEQCTTPAKTCRRHACRNTSGLYICNDNASELKFNCTSVHDWFSDVAGSCCTQMYTKSKGISGRLFSDQDWNVIVAYANCNHGQDADKPTLGPKDDPWGPNGACENK